MNYLYLAAGIIALFATVGHFTMGQKSFMKPVLDSDVELIPKKVMHGLFHYMSVHLVFTTVVMLAFSFGELLWFQNTRDVSLILGATYAGFAIVQIIIAATSSLQGGLMKLFQWVFWALIALFAFWGTI